MARARLAALAVAAVMGLASTGAAAQLCGGGSAAGGFDDVLTTNNFCTATLWMKNRGVTLGCTNALYCPGDVVTRASMALFMNRLGTALTPQFQNRQSAMAATNLTPGNFVPFCFGGPLAAVNYPRTARARGTINVPAAGPELSMFLVMTLNGTPYVNMNTLFNRVNAPNGRVNISWSSNALSVPPGQTVGFAIGISNSAGAGTLVLGAGECAIEADVTNTNPTSPPFDE